LLLVLFSNPENTDPTYSQFGLSRQQARVHHEASIGVSDATVKRTASFQAAGDRNERHRVLAWR
jgi:hypothetical protein